MISKSKTKDGWVWQAYARAPTCSTPCDHKECVKPKRTRKIYVGTFSTANEAISAVDHIERESRKVRDACDALHRRSMALGIERDRLQQAIDGIQDLLTSCDEAKELVDCAIAMLSKHV